MRCSGSPGAYVMPVLLMNQLGYLITAIFQVLNLKQDNHQLFFLVNLCYFVYCFLECEYCRGILLKDMDAHACREDPTHAA